MPDVNDPTQDPRLIAGFELLGRTGAADFQLRYHDDEEPVVWFAVVRYTVGADGRPQPDGPINSWETAAGHNPLEAVLRLCRQVIDGGTCAHCERPTMFHEKLDEQPTPFDHIFCSYEWDPELVTFRRSCEGDTP